MSSRRLVQTPGPGAAKSASLLVSQLNQHSPNNASDAKSLQNPVK